MGHGPKFAIELQPSEASVLQAASRIYAAHVSAGFATTGTEDALIEHCLDVAIRMALRLDRLVQSDGEVSSLRRRGPA